ncbi:MAG: glycosyltransferase family 4 protein [Sedimenticola sp.]
MLRKQVSVSIISMISDPPLKLLTFTSLYPNRVVPNHGVFVENRLRKLIDSENVTSKVVAPVPWFPFGNDLFGEYAKYSRVPKSEVRNNLSIEHPKYIVIPKIGMNLTPRTMASAALPVIKKIISDGYDFDLIDAHYFYPDGVAAVIIAEQLGKPVVITARGSDINLISNYKKPREMIKWAADKCDAAITVCQSLKDKLLELDVPEDHISVMRNGVDLEKFVPPKNREGLRNHLTISGKTILSVGNLIELKGHHLIIESLKILKDVTLLIAGRGPDLEKLKKFSEECGVSERVRFLGPVTHETLKDYYGASDMLVLASSREGWANVLLESMACGTPVVATNVGGTSEVVTTREAGLLLETRSVECIADGVLRMYSELPDRSSTRSYAEEFSWDETSRGLKRLFSKVINK